MRKRFELFRDEFTRELVKRGPYKFADEPAPDVLLVVPAIEELDIRRRTRGSSPCNSTYLTRRPVTMKMTGDIRDALTGKLVGRVINYRLPEQNPNNELRIANRTAMPTSSAWCSRNGRCSCTRHSMWRRRRSPGRRNPRDSSRSK